MKKSKLYGAILGMAMVVMLSACGVVKESSKSEEVNPTTVTIGMMSSSDVIPYVLINEKGLLKEKDVILNLEVFTSAKDRDAAFTAGELDGVLTDMIGVSMYQNANFDVRITGITDGDYILVAGEDTGIKTLADIKGKSIAISENTLIDYSLDYILTNNNMMSDDVVKEIVPRIPDRLELLRHGQIDLGLLPEPFVTLAIVDGATPLGSANEFGLYPAVSAFSMSSIEAKEEAIQAIYEAYNEAVTYMNETPLTEYEELVIKSVGYPEEMIGTITIPEFRISELPEKEVVESAIQWASERGLCKSDLSYEQVTYDIYR